MENILVLVSFSWEEKNSIIKLTSKLIWIYLGKTSTYYATIGNLQTSKMINEWIENQIGTEAFRLFLEASYSKWKSVHHKVMLTRTTMIIDSNIKYGNVKMEWISSSIDSTIIFVSIHLLIYQLTLFIFGFRRILKIFNDISILWILYDKQIIRFDK